MHKKRGGVWFILSIAMLCVSFFCFAEDNDDEDIVIVPSTQVIEGDLKVVSKSVEIAGEVKGDLYVMASQVYIDGIVHGDVICMAGLLDVKGVVKRGIRGMAGQIMIGGEVGENISIAAASIEFSPTSKSHGSIIAFAGSCDLLGLVSKNATIFASFLRVSGVIAGKLSAHVGSLRILSKAKILGGMEYFSNEPAFFDQGAKVGGHIVHNPSFIYTLSQKGFLQKIRIGSKIAGSVMNFFFSLILGFILIQFFRNKLDHAAKIISKRPFYVLFTGIVITLLFPIVALVFLISIVGTPFALGLIALNLIGVYAAKIVTLYYFGLTFLKKWNFYRYPKRYYLALLVVYFFLTFIPVFGWFLSLICMLFGYGAVIAGNVKAPSKRQLKK
ncbi:MAG: polymer-forming cytoskeletal protein [Simkaniaceae bacterium]|nr:polymer-forming cytoskeletal protein [Simkaniaceae bacterium]